MPAERRDQMEPQPSDGSIPVSWLDTSAGATTWEGLSRIWFNLPAALLIGFVALVTVLPSPPIGGSSTSLPGFSSDGDDGEARLAAVDSSPESIVTSSLAATATSAPALAPASVATPAPQLTAPPETPTVAATPGASTTDLAALGDVRPNELGGVPIIMYHAFTTNPDYLDEWTLTFDQFREQLDWYREHDFVMVGVQSMIDGRFDVPAGKTPIILTFDDSSAGQFGLQDAPGGGFEVKPDTAVGVLEEYRETYPEFVGPAFFAILTWNCFESEGDPSTCGERLNWLVDHGYEIGNHTWDHVDMTDVSDDFFVNSIGSMIDWLNDLVPSDKPGNLSDVVVMPFGAYPDPDLHPEQRQWLADGFWYNGEQVTMPLVLTVNGGPAVPPWGMQSYPSVTFRIASEPGILGWWQDAILSGDAPIFISDGDPGVITIPAGQIDNLDEAWAANHGLEVRTYDASES
jgi:peptidoglycan/xylan/chitin deacetylase (PgdA/CDA1 family)